MADTFQWFREAYIKEHNKRMRERKEGFTNIDIDLEEYGFKWGLVANNTMCLADIFTEFIAGNYIIDGNDVPMNVEDFVDWLVNSGLVTEEYEIANLEKIARRIMR